MKSVTKTLVFWRMEEISMQLLLQIYWDEKLGRQQERLSEQRSRSGDNKQQRGTCECLLMRLCFNASLCMCSVSVLVWELVFTCMSCVFVHMCVPVWLSVYLYVVLQAVPQRWSKEKKGRETLLLQYISEYNLVLFTSVQLSNVTS